MNPLEFAPAVSGKSGEGACRSSLGRALRKVPGSPGARRRKRRGSVPPTGRVTLAVKPWSLTALSFRVFRPILAGRRNGKARSGEPKIIRSYFAAVLSALGGAFVVTCASWTPVPYCQATVPGKRSSTNSARAAMPWITRKPVLAFAAFLDDGRQVFPRCRTRNHLRKSAVT